MKYYIPLLVLTILVLLHVARYAITVTSPPPLVDIPVLHPTVTVAAQLPDVEEEEDYVVLNRVTAYNPVPRQTMGDPGVSSCGPNRDRQLAVSRDLFFDEHGRKHLCGRVVTLETDRGEVFENYVIWDTMAPRFTLTADVMFPETNEESAWAFGVTTGRLIFH